MEEKFSVEEMLSMEEMLSTEETVSTVKGQDAREQCCAAWRP